MKSFLRPPSSQFLKTTNFKTSYRQDFDLRLHDCVIIIGQSHLKGGIGSIFPNVHEPNLHLHKLW
uniref:Uncharacterized protein n=1 Tax=Anguilla anguilla TaxID=7936 RepID=A0A0E9X200_ANGAN